MATHWGVWDYEQGEWFMTNWQVWYNESYAVALAQSTIILAFKNLPPRNWKPRSIEEWAAEQEAAGKEVGKVEFAEGAE